MLRIIKYLLLAVIVVLGISFAILNAETVAINYYVGDSQLPLSLLMILMLIVGVVIGFLVSMRNVFKLKRHKKRLQKRLKVIEEEIENLRTMPLKDAHH